MRLRNGIGLLAITIVFLLGVVSCATSKTETTVPAEKTKVGTGTVKVGDTAPDFEMRNQEQLMVALSDYKDKKNVVLVFYPADFTPV